MSTLSTPALNLRAEIAETQGLRRSIKPGLRRVAFANLVTNGDFAAGTTGWEALFDAVISESSGQFTVNNGGGSFQSARQLISLRQGATYLATVDTIEAPGRINIANEGGGIEMATSAQAIGTNFTTFLGEDVVQFRLQCNSATTTEEATFDNAHLWEADPSDDAPWLRLPAGHRLGDAGRVVRDGLELMDGDFTEILTGIGDNLQAFIKPTTAPGVSTKFNVWCAPQ